jgi:hypothetical protein
MDIDAHWTIDEASASDRHRLLSGQMVAERRWVRAVAFMTVGKVFRRTKCSQILLVAALAAIAIAAVPSLRETILRAVGWAIVIGESEPVASADIIVVSLNSDGAGALEAADLVQGGIAKRVAVFMDPPTREGQEFNRRGLSQEGPSARQIRQLQSLGVADVVQIPGIDLGTQSEGQVLAALVRRASAPKHSVCGCQGPLATIAAGASPSHERSSVTGHSSTRALLNF